jgi:DNA mismatch repair ATPase MutS
MRLDCTALTNLEVLQGATGMRAGSLLDVLDTCVSVSGKRMIRKWLSQPLYDVDAILRRQNAVKAILADSTLMQVITDGLRGLPDMDRCDNS